MLEQKHFRVLDLVYLVDSITPGRNQLILKYFYIQYRYPNSQTIYTLFVRCCSYFKSSGGHDGAVVTHSPPNSEVDGLNPEPYVGKLVISY